MAINKRNYIYGSPVAITKEIFHDYVIEPFDFFILANTENKNITIRLQDASQESGREIKIKNIGVTGNTVLILPINSTDTIDLEPNYTISGAMDSITLSIHNGKWWIT